MKHFLCWPGQLAYAGNKPRRHAYYSQWHRNGGAGFGVRRPLRYLAHRLDLDEGQTRRMAAVLNQLKTEREQAALDEKRTIADLAKLLTDTGELPTLEEVSRVLSPRVETSERLNQEVAKAVVAMCDFLDSDQREELVSLLLTGAISL